LAGYDIAIVGAGPAGASAAYFAARGGRRVLLIDKAAFPRSKPCGEGVTYAALQQIQRMGMGQWLEQGAFIQPAGVRLGAPNGAHVSVAIPPSDEPLGLIRMIPRRDLDLALIETATRAGAEFRPSVRALDLAADDQTALLACRHDGVDQMVQAQVIILTDGSCGPLSRSLVNAGKSSTGVARALQKLRARARRRNGQLMVATRGYVQANDLRPQWFEFVFQGDTLPYFYWAFPLGSGLCNVGLLAPRCKGGARLAARLRRSLTEVPALAERLPHAQWVGNPRGCLLNSRYQPSAAFGDRLLLAGDAAGLVSPLMGEGISQAMISGELAAETALAGLERGDCSRWGLAPYEKALRYVFSKSVLEKRFMHWLLRGPWAINRLVDLLNRDPELRKKAGELMAQRATPDDLLTPQLLWKLLAQRAPHPNTESAG